MAECEPDLKYNDSCSVHVTMSNEGRIRELPSFKHCDQGLLESQREFARKVLDVNISAAISEIGDVIRIDGKDERKKILPTELKIILDYLRTRAESMPGGGEEGGT